MLLSVKAGNSVGDNGQSVLSAYCLHDVCMLFVTIKHFMCLFGRSYCVWLVCGMLNACLIRWPESPPFSISFSMAFGRILYIVGYHYNLALSPKNKTNVMSQRCASQLVLFVSALR